MSELAVWLVCSGVLISASGAAGGEVPYATHHVIEPGDGTQTIAAKAARTLPRPNQVAWMDYEFTIFIHFGPNTFSGAEWGTGREEPAVFNPTAMDAEQWVVAAKEAGAKLLVLVSKHHEGFCLWPSRYTAHSVAASPWLGGKGDVVRAVTAAAARHGVKVGVYLSPADLYQMKTNPANPAGYYGNNSESRPSVIPTDPAHFQDAPEKGRATVAGFPTFTYTVDDYNRYFLNQLYELLTDYGPIAEVWFDGANPNPKVKQSYQYAAWYDLIRKLSPEAVIFGKGPDARWVGNERGIARETEWSVIPLPESPESFSWSDLTGQDLGSRARLQPGSHLWWYPAEADVPVLNGWFWSRAKSPRPVTQLVEIYYASVGRNANLLLNLSPDDRGLVPENQLAPLREMSRIVRATFATNLLESAAIHEEKGAKNLASRLTDKKNTTWWEAPVGQTNGTLIFNWPTPISFDVVSIQEAVATRGQRIEGVELDIWSGTQWEMQAVATTVGHKRLFRFPLISTDKVRVRITGSRLEPTLAEAGIYRQPSELLAKYAPRSGSQRQAGWKVVSVSSEETSSANEAGRNAIDGDPATIWHTRWSSASAGPHHITVDMGSARPIEGFSYLPRQDGNFNGTPEHFRFEISTNNLDWVSTVPAGSFGNIRNNPSRQDISFPATMARYFRFSATNDVNRKEWLNAAEISVIPAGKKPDAP